MNVTNLLNIAQWSGLTHPALLLAEAATISAALSLIDRQPARERLYYGLYAFCSFGVATLTGGWIMQWIHG
jgi:hypothetical protein